MLKRRQLRWAVLPEPEEFSVVYQFLRPEAPLMPEFQGFRRESAWASQGRYASCLPWTLFYFFPRIVRLQRSRRLGSRTGGVQIQPSGLCYLPVTMQQSGVCYVLVTILSCCIQGQSAWFTCIQLYTLLVRLQLL